MVDGWNCLEAFVGPGAGTVLPGTGLPISPGAMLPRLLPDGATLTSDSNFTNVPLPSSFWITNEPPPFCGFPSVSQMSSISESETGGSPGGLSCSICLRTVLTSWKPGLALFGLTAVKCLHAWITIWRIATGLDVCGRCGLGAMPNALPGHPPKMRCQRSFATSWVRDYTNLDPLPRTEGL